MNKFSLSIIVLSCLVSTNYTSGQHHPQFNRQSNIVSLYSLSPTQTHLYNKIINEFDEKHHALTRQLLSKKEKSDILIDLGERMEREVIKVFNAGQFEKWKTNHCYYLPTRFYIEDVGLTLEEYEIFRGYSLEYQNEKKRINEMTLSSTEREQFRDAALNKYHDNLVKLMDAQIAQYLIDYNLLRVAAGNLSADFTIISEYKARKHAEINNKYFAEEKIIKDLTFPRKENWQSLENAIQKIMADCMGGNLVNSLIEKLDGKTFIIQFDLNSNSSFFDYGKGSLTFNTFESNTILHELFHAYQSYGETTATMNSSQLNRELEARYAQYKYVSTLPEYQPGTKWYNRYHQNSIDYDIAGFDNYITKNGLINPNKETEFMNLYWHIAQAFQGSQSVYAGRSIDYNRDVRENFKNYFQLTKDC